MTGSGTGFELLSLPSPKSSYSVEAELGLSHWKKVKWEQVEENHCDGHLKAKIKLGLFHKDQSGTIL